MSATPQEIDQLKQHIAEGTAQSSSYLANLQAKLHEFDEKNKVSETASSYLQAGLDKAHSSVDELKALGAKIKDNAEGASEPWLKSAQAALATLNASLGDLKVRAIDYDQRTRSSIGESVSHVKQTASTSLESIVTSTHGAATSAIDTLSATITSVQSSIAERASTIGHGAYATTGSVIKKAEQVDEKFGVSAAIAGGVAAVTVKVADLDKKLGVTETASSVDEKVTGGIGASLYNKGADLVHQGVEFVTSHVQGAKAAADKA